MVQGRLLAQNQYSRPLLQGSTCSIPDACGEMLLQQVRHGQGHSVAAALAVLVWALSALHCMLWVLKVEPAGVARAQLCRTQRLSAAARTFS